MQINLSNFLKSGFHYLVLTVLMLSFAIFLNFKIYKAESIKSEQISNLQEFISENPLVLNKPIESFQIAKVESPKQILIIFEKFMQGYPDLKLKSLSLNEKSEGLYIVSLSVDSTSQDYINFIDDLSLKSPINSEFPFVVEFSDYKLDIPSLDSLKVSNFKSTLVIHTL